MATFSKSFSNNSKYTLILTVTEVVNSTNIVNNTTDVDWELKMTSGSSYFAQWGISSEVVVNGETVHSQRIQQSISANSSLVIASGTKTIKHEDNGKKTISCSASVSTSSEQSYLPGSASVSGDLTLTTIPRKSEVTCPSFNAGDSTNIVISKKDSSFTSTIRYVFGDLSDTIATKTKETVVGWTPNADDFYAQFPDTKQKSGTIYCDTYSGSTLIGTSETSFTCYAKESDCIPDISLVVKDVNFATKSLTNNENVIIKGISDAQLLVAHTTKNNATISKLIVSCGDGQKITNTLNGTLYAVNSGVFTATVTDSRGFSNSTTVEKTVENGLLVDYVKLAITNVDIGRPETTSNIIKANIKGNYYNGRFGQGLKKRNVQVGDDLSGKTLYFTFPDGFRELLNGANATIIQGSNKHIKEINYTDTGEIYVGVHNGDDFYSYDTTFGETILTECVMPDDFGEVTEINIDSISYQYIFVETEEDNVNSLKLTYRYRETGGEWSAQPVEELKTTLNVTELEEFMGGDVTFNLTGGTNDGESYNGTIPADDMPNWIKTETDAEGNLIAKVYIYKTGDYIELTPTISGNGFTFNGELGNNFDYKKQYEFEFYAEDELMYVSASDKPIIVTKGISIIRVGDGYVDIRGDLLQNGKVFSGGEDSITGDTLPIGSMIPYGKSTAPTNWLICDGSAVSRTTYAELFAVIGTSYGVGDGSTTFNLPNKKGRVSVGLDTSDSKFNAIGKTGGSATHKLTVNEMPGHTHDGLYWQGTKGISLNSGGTSGYHLQWGSGDNGEATSMVTNTRGGSKAHNNLQPYEVDCWIIKAFQSAGVVAEVVNTESTSTTYTYSCDYINGIIESGSNENGSWTKWADGTMICAKTVEGTTSFATAWGTLYESDEISLGNYPVKFSENPKVAITNHRYTGYWLESHYDYGTAQAGKIILLRPNTYADATYGLDIIAFGKWK